MPRMPGFFFCHKSYKKDSNESISSSHYVPLIAPYITFQCPSWEWTSSHIKIPKIQQQNRRNERQIHSHNVISAYKYREREKKWYNWNLKRQLLKHTMEIKWKKKKQARVNEMNLNVSGKQPADNKKRGEKLSAFSTKNKNEFNFHPLTLS